MRAAPINHYPEVAQNERRLAMVMHLVCIFTPLWLPFIIWAVTRHTKSPFLQAHSRQAAFDGIYWKAFMILIFIVSAGFTISQLIYQFQTNWEEFTWSQVVVRALISFLIFISLWVFNLVQSIFQARAASKGIWPKRERKKFDRELPPVQPTG